MNSISIVGRLGKDPETQVTQGGMTITKFSVAVDRNKGGEKVTDWFEVKTFAKTAEVARDHLTKGRQVGVTGSMQNESWEKDGQKRDRWILAANTLTFVGDRPAGGGQGRGDDDFRDLDAPARPAARQAAPARRPADLDDEIPF